MSSISALAGMLSSNSCYGNIHVATRLMKIAFPEDKNLIKGDIDCFKYVIASYQPSSVPSR